jgi:hypothetical protein
LASEEDNLEDAIRRAERLVQAISPATATVEAGGGGPHTPTMSDERIAKLEGAYDPLKVVRPVTLAVLVVFVAVMIGGFAFMGAQLVRIDGQLGQLDGKIDAIPQRLSDEFRAMGSEMSAQTSALANAITAARQMEPRTTPQAPPNNPPPQPPPPKRR